MTLRFACGHTVTIANSETTAPRCGTCGETRITRVEAPPPQFRGVGTGPYHKGTT